MKFSDFSLTFDSKLQNSLTCNKIPWLFPDSEKDWNFSYFSLTIATLQLFCLYKFIHHHMYTKWLLWKWLKGAIGSTLRARPNALCDARSSAAMPAEPRYRTTSFNQGWGTRTSSTRVLNFWYSYCTRTPEFQSNSTHTCTRGQVLRYSYEYWHKYWYYMIWYICEVRVKTIIPVK